ncbi:FMN-binding protein [Arthrobacter sp. Leaf234]|uniref:FMN-binding protein n=1 Tax=Arthrobacter sp. Leaf234 TaxID=1736303 RepID=UPI00138F740A|nr:FMN-binding protein [Arthrobacter sp. Leaf234]
MTVTITVADGAVADATAELSTTHGDKSERINTCAVPLLREEALQAQSAEISMISGATYTSEAYLESLQSALDQAGL